MIKSIFVSLKAIIILLIALVFLDELVGLSTAVYRNMMIEQTSGIGSYTQYYYGLGWEPRRVWFYNCENLETHESIIAGQQYNNEGFRVRRNSCSPENANVWIFGGSIMQGINVPCADTLPDILQQEFQDFHAYNFGYCGATSENGIRILKFFLAKGFRPELVLWAFGVNDSFEGFIENKHNWNRQTRTGFFWKHSFLWWYFHKATPRDPPFPPPKGDLERFLANAERADEARVPLPRYLEIHREVIGLSKQHHFQLMTVGETFIQEPFLRTQSKFAKLRKNYGLFKKEFYKLPPDYPDFKKSALDMINVISYQDNLEAQCRQNSLPYVRMNDGIRLYPGPDYELFQQYPFEQPTRQDPMHPRGAGLRMGAIPVKEALVKLGWSKRPQPLEPNYSPYPSLTYDFGIPCPYRRAIRKDYLYVIVFTPDNQGLINLENWGVYIRNKDGNLESVSTNGTYFLYDSYRPDDKPLIPQMSITSEIYKGHVVIKNTSKIKIDDIVREKKLDLYLGVIIKNIGLI